MFITKKKFDLEKLYLDMKLYILIFFKNYVITRLNLVLILLKKITLFTKIKAVMVHEAKAVSCCTQLSLQALVLL